MQTVKAHRALGTLALAIALGALPPAAAAENANSHDEADEEIGSQEFDVPILPDPAAARARDRGIWPNVKFQADTSGMVNGDFGSADVSWVHAGGEWELQIPASERLGLQLEIGADTAIYDFDGNESFLNAGQSSGDPFDELIDTRARRWGRFRLNDAWSLVGVTSIGSRFEEGAPFASGLEGGGALGGSYTYGDDRLELMVAVGAKSRMHKSGVGLVTIVRAAWKINERFRLRAGLNGGRLSAQISDTLRASVFGYVQGNRYRLADRNDGFGGVGRGSLREQYAPVGVALRWKPDERWRLNLSLGSVVYQQLKVYDEDADSFGKSTLDKPAFYGALRVVYRFGR
jgi:hypothetical protein